jgi:hypothetical protein
MADRLDILDDEINEIKVIVDRYKCGENYSIQRADLSSFFVASALHRR